MQNDLVNLRIVPETGRVEWLDGYDVCWYPLADTVEEAIEFLTKMLRTSTTNVRFHRWETCKGDRVWNGEHCNL